MPPTAKAADYITKSNAFNWFVSWFIFCVYFSLTRADNIYKDGELPEKATHKDFLLVQKEGARNVKRNIAHYNLDVIIAIGYRVQSDVAVRFRRWATQRLHEYIQKGFTMDDERLKQGRNRYFRELLHRIRDIRSSERNFYQQVTDIYATATDYEKSGKGIRDFPSETTRQP